MRNNTVFSVFAQRTVGIIVLTAAALGALVQTSAPGAMHHATAAAVAPAGGSTGWE